MAPSDYCAIEVTNRASPNICVYIYIYIHCKHGNTTSISKRAWKIVACVSKSMLVIVVVNPQAGY